MQTAVKLRTLTRRHSSRASLHMRPETAWWTLGREPLVAPLSANTNTKQLKGTEYINALNNRLNPINQVT